MSYQPQIHTLSSFNGQAAAADKSRRSPSPTVPATTRLINTFCTRNSIHGVNNFLRESTGVYERFTWLLVLTLTVIGMVYVSLILSQRFTEGKFQTVVDSTTYPVYEIVFPTITVCNHNRLNWRRLEAAQTKFLPLEKDASKLDLFARFIAAFDGFRFGRFDSFKNVSDAPLKVLNDVNFSSVFAFMTWTCEEMLGDCKWRNERFDCCEVFYQQKSELGLCYSFNGVQNDASKRKEQMDPFYPLHNSNYGPKSALEVRVHIRPEDHLPGSQMEKGVIVMVHEPSVWQKDGFFVPWNTETSVEIDPVIFFYDNDTRRISSSFRKCVFDDERNSADFKSIPGYVYMLSNCYSQCRQEHLMRYCNCTLDLLYPPGDFPACQASDFHCIYSHRDDFRYMKRKGEERVVFNQHEGMMCKCYRNCFSLNYITEVRPSYLPTNILGNGSYVDLDVHYRFDSIMLYRTSLVFGWVDLMVSFGGIAGLFLGCSLISAVEVMYFFTVDIPRFVFSRLRGWWRQRKAAVTVVPPRWAREQPKMRMLSALNAQAVAANKPRRPATTTRTETRKLVNKFCTRNSIHGVNNFLRESTGVYERFTWLLVLTLTVIGMVYVSLILSQRFTEGKLQTVVDSTTYPVYEIVFPTITVCNQNRLNWKRLEAAKAKFLPLEKDAFKLDLFARFIASYDGIMFGLFDSFKNVSDAPLKVLNDVNFSSVFAFMTWTCQEMLGDCKWRNERFDCCEVFYQQKSELGLCYSFNGVQNDASKRKEQMDPFYPLHNSNYGPSSALEVKVFIRPEDHVPGSQMEKGIIVMVHEPPVWQKDAFFVPWNTETTVEIDPVIFFYDNDTRRISSSFRKCVFDDERNSADFKSIPGYVYMLENCFSQCHQEHLMRYCNCTLDLLYPPGELPACRASDFHCIYQHRDDFRYTKRKGEERVVYNQHEGMTCKCFRNCYSLNYITEVRPSYLPTNILGNGSYVDLDVHYRFDSIMLYRTSLVFGWVDLMVSFGGIAGLFLGCSLISAVEIIYFLGVDVTGFVFNWLRGWWQRRRPPQAVTPQRWAGGLPMRAHNLGMFHGDNVLGTYFK